MGSKYEQDPLIALAALVGRPELVDDSNGIIPGIVPIFDPKTGGFVDIWELTEEEKDTLRQIAGEITHYRLFKR